MNKNLWLFILAVGLSSFFCCQDTVEPINTDNDPIDYEDCDRNALRMDLYLSNTARPSFDYYHNILDHMKLIDEDYGDTYSDILWIGFRFPYMEDELIVSVDDTTRSLIDSGEYQAWDSLNTLYDLDTILVEEHWILLKFLCCSDMTFLDDYYSQLPGITNVSRNWRNWPETNLYPRSYGDTISYLYVYCHDLQPEGGCSYREYLYFRIVRNEIGLVGYWGSHTGEELPDWWFEEAMYNDLQYYEWYYYGIWPGNDT